MNDPVVVGRRAALASGALGITSLALPRAVSAASSDGPAGQGGGIGFSQSDEVLVAWYLGAADGIFTSSSATQSNTNPAPSGVSGTMGLGGPYSANRTDLDAAESGIAPLSDGRHWYRIKYQAPAFDPSDPDAPFWRWTVVAGASGISFRAFVLGGFNASSSTMFSLRSSVDGYASSLRDFSGDDTGEYRRVVINLASLARLGGNQSITFRLYVRRTDSSSDQVFLSGGNSINSGLTAADDYAPVMDNWPMAFIGSI